MGLEEDFGVRVILEGLKGALVEGGVAAFGRGGYDFSFGGENFVRVGEFGLENGELVCMFWGNRGNEGEDLRGTSRFVYRSCRSCRGK